MRLAELLTRLGVPAPQQTLAGDPEIRRVVHDSREVRPGDLFVAVRGFTVDGHQFVRRALEQGAAALAVEDAAFAPEGVPCALVTDARVALACLAAILAGEPTLRLLLAGITGTNGKTTTTYLVEAILEAAGYATGVVGTVGYRYAGKTLPAPHTTPDPVALQLLFADMVNAGVRAAVMETSSHALDQRRVEGCDYSVAAFTNLTQDHLDYHHTMDAYFAAKKRFFTELLPASRAPSKTAVINLDDPRGLELARACPTPVLTYGIDRPGASILATAPVFGEHGVRARVETPAGPFELTSPLVGGYNLQNLLCAVGIGVGLGIAPQTIGAALATCPGAPGRLERVDNPHGFGVFVDYAHTPDALLRVLQAVRAQTRGRVLTVFGCGGDRDRTKRPLMGEVAASVADLCVVTSDNPRTEDPQSIVDMILAGITANGAQRLDTTSAARPDASGYLVDVDRRRAIEAALRAARPGDSVVIAGKGHEDYQILGKTKVHFDDREEARAVLEKLNA